MIRIFTALAVLVSCFFLLTSEFGYPKTEEKTVIVFEEFHPKKTIALHKRKKTVTKTIEETVSEPELSTDVLYDISSDDSSEFKMPVLDIVYPSSMRKRSIEASFEVDVSFDGNGICTLVFPKGVRTEFKKAVEDAFKKANISVTDVHFVLPIEFRLK